MTKLFDCPQCHKQIGVTKLVGNVELLEINGVLCREIRCFCTTCGTEIWYSVSDAMLRKLVERVISSRQ